MKPSWKWAATGILGAALAIGGAGCAWLHSDPPTLSSWTWELDDDDMPGAPKLPKHAPDVTLTVMPDGRIAGCAGVNRYSGRIQTDPATQTFKLTQPPAVTRMAGPGLEFEQYYLKQLQTVDHYRFVDDDELELLSGNTVVAKFEKMD